MSSRCFATSSPISSFVQPLSEYDQNVPSGRVKSSFQLLLMFLPFMMMTGGVATVPSAAKHSMSVTSSRLVPNQRGI